jgi:hypothetical protein
MSFQKGDRHITIGEQPYLLRLTMGALADISQQLSARSPYALSQRVQALTLAEARVLLTCLLRPAPFGALTVTVAALPAAEIQRLLPDICAVFEESFRRE